MYDRDDYATRETAKLAVVLGLTLFVGLLAIGVYRLAALVVGG